MIDFDALVLAPAMDTFARPIVVTPTVSIPGAPAYSLQVDGLSLLRGVWRSRPVDVALADGTGILSSQEHTLGIRLREFLIPPKPGDTVLLSATANRPALGPFYIEDVDEDGEGGAMWMLKAVSA